MVLAVYYSSTMGANNHVTVVPTNFKDDNENEADSAETGIEPNYGVARSQGAGATERGGDSEVLH